MDHRLGLAKKSNLELLLLLVEAVLIGTVMLLTMRLINSVGQASDVQLRIVERLADQAEKKDAYE